MGILKIIGILVIAVIILLFATKTRKTKPFTDKNGTVIENSIAEQVYLTLGGVKQWVLLRGANVNNPILLFLHGGPGISVHGLLRYYNSDLENHPQKDSDQDFWTYRQAHSTILSLPRFATIPLDASHMPKWIQTFASGEQHS